MKINNLYPLKMESISYAILLLGVLGDHISTGIALTRNNIRESNPIALNLMNQNIWIQTDLVLIVTSILTTYIATRLVKSSGSRYFLVLPLLAGLIRLTVTFWNISLLF